MRITGNTSINELIHSEDMSAKEAYEIFHIERKDLVVKSCFEYPTRFVFHAVSEKYANSSEADRVFDSLYYVDKGTGRCASFNPFDISIEEYKLGKKVPTFKAR